jgi:hypothetical protein
MISALYPNQVKAVKKDNNLYDMLALIDAVRLGRPREHAKAIELLNQLFNRQYV